MHQIALYGVTRTLLMILGDRIGRSLLSPPEAALRPRVDKESSLVHNTRNLLAG
jgi:hypothetical protein